MTSPYIGQIAMVGFNFAPRNWAVCNGQLLSIAQNTALFSILGTTYGGNGTTNFALPDLRGRAPMHVGTAAGTNVSVVLGETLGEEGASLLTTEMPAHGHTVSGEALACGVDPGTSSDPVGRYPAVNSRPLYADSPTGNLGTIFTTGTTGGALPHDNMQPYLTVNFIIALNGIFPARN
jgi:microcystin-dependent protein